MKKIFCDHCGKDITEGTVNELSIEECHLDYNKDLYVGVNCELCDDCYIEREQALADFDRVFLKLEGK